MKEGRGSGRLTCRIQNPRATGTVGPGQTAGGVLPLVPLPAGHSWWRCIARWSVTVSVRRFPHHEIHRAIHWWRLLPACSLRRRQFPVSWCTRQWRAVSVARQKIWFFLFLSFLIVLRAMLFFVWIIISETDQSYWAAQPSASRRWFSRVLPRCGTAWG